MYMVENTRVIVESVTGSCHRTRCLISTISSWSTMRWINFSFPFLETYCMTPSVWIGTPSADRAFVVSVLKFVTGRIGVVRKSLRFISTFAKTTKV